MPFPSNYVPEMYFTIAFSFLFVKVNAYSEAASIEKVGFCFGDGYTYWDTLQPYTCFWVPFYGPKWDNLTVVAYGNNGYSSQVSLGIASFGFSNFYGYGQKYYPGYHGGEKSEHTLEKLKQALSKCTFNQKVKQEGLKCGEKSAITMGYLNSLGFTVENGIGDHTSMSGHSWVIVHLSDGSEYIVETNSDTRPHVEDTVKKLEKVYLEERRDSWETIELYMKQYSQGWKNYLDVQP